MNDLEDDIEIQITAAVKDRQPVKFSRLRKAGDKEVVAAHVNDAYAPVSDSDEDQEPVNDLTEQQVQQEDVADEEGGEAVIDGDDEYWDEEDDLENYLRTRFEKDGDSSDDEGAREGAPRKDKETDAPVEVGTNPEDINAETQRILREAASKDRLGKGHKIEIKPLNSIVDKLLARRALAIARAPKVTRVAVPSFDDILAEAGARGQPPAAANIDQTAVPDAAVAASAEKSFDELQQEDDDDLIIASQDEVEDEEGAAGLAVVDLPGTEDAKKKKKSMFGIAGGLDFVMQDSHPLDDNFEDEVLLDDGAGTDSDSDDDSQRSWEARPDDKEAEKRDIEDEENEVSGGKPQSSEDTDSDVDEENEEEEEGEEDEGAATMEEEDNPSSKQGGEASEGGKEKSSDDGAAGEPAVVSLKSGPDANPITFQRPKLQERLQRVFLDTEAELSDEEGAAAGVSDDEDEDVDDQGELAGLIANNAQEGEVDVAKREEFHRKWAEQQDVKDLQKLLRGLEQGFRRKRLGAGLDDDDGDLDGRRRRMRMGDDDDDLAMGGWLSNLLAREQQGMLNGDEEEEDIEMLLKAHRQRLLAGSQQEEMRGGSDPGIVIPMDEDSQHVLGLLRSASEPQPCVAPQLPPSRLAMQMMSMGSAEPTKAHLKSAGPSFLGRQPSAVHRSVSNSGFGGGGGRSFIFGRDNSQGAAPADFPKSQEQQKGGGAGPTDFANLRQMAGLGGNSSNPIPKPNKKPKSSLVSKLEGKGRKQSQNEDCEAANAVCQQIILGRSNRN